MGIHYELMHLWRTSRKDGEGHVDHYNTALPEYGDEDMTDTESVTVGVPMAIVKYILKHDLKEYKLVKREKRK